MKLKIAQGPIPLDKIPTTKELSCGNRGRGGQPTEQRGSVLAFTFIIHNEF